MFRESNTPSFKRENVFFSIKRKTIERLTPRTHSDILEDDVYVRNVILEEILMNEFLTDELQ